MAHSSGSDEDRSVYVGGNVNSTTMVTGDRNVIRTTYKQVTLPPPENVNMAAELSAFRKLLAQLDSPDRRKIDNAISDAEHELAKPEPDKDEVGSALDRALAYATKAEKFAEVAGKLTPHVKSVVAWLGGHWHKLLGVVGLTI